MKREIENQELRSAKRDFLISLIAGISANELDKFLSQLITWIARLIAG